MDDSGLRAQGSGRKERSPGRKGRWQPIVLGLALLTVAGGLTWLLFVWLPNLAESRIADATPAAVAPSAETPAETVRKIKARLFYVAADGAHLTGLEREVTYGAGTVDQAREILRAQLEAVSDPLISPIPAGTTLRAVFVVGDQVFVDVTGDIASAHPGGAVAEQLTVYAVVHALTLNLPAVKAVQILIDGREAETLAGHIDLRRPLPQNTQLTVAN